MSKRVCIYAKDVSTLLGKSYKQAVRILATIKAAYGKRCDQYVTIEEFASYTGIDLATVQAQCWS
ncbi:MAG: hypothetical protein LBJ04_04155 [Sphingobacterium sp.]|jgi:hypothetical protein|nr:hypothetical protein [Sphingobacterium sp.]